MRVSLTTEIPVEYVSVFAEMAWLERRPELGLLCQQARKTGSRLLLATVQAVVPGLKDAGARNVIAWCKTLGLCDEHGCLTTLGEDVAAHQEAPIPEQGVYGLWLAQHPLMGRRILAVQRLSSRADARFESIVGLPIEPERKRVFQSVTDPKQRFLLRDLPSNNGQRGCVRGPANATCKLKWSVDFESRQNQWQIDGTIATGPPDITPITHTPESDELDLDALERAWGQGPLAAFGRWQVAERRLAVPFSGLTEEEQESFTKTLQLPQVEVPGKGTYANVRLEAVPIGPAGTADAQKWAHARFIRCLDHKPAYRSRSEARRLFAELVEGTPLERLKPELPAHKALLEEQRVRKNMEQYWLLAAPVDLAPHPVSQQELNAFSIDASKITTGEVNPRSFQIPYRGGWSMLKLVTQLLAGTLPRRVLLCDRYVRGAKNMESLQLLVKAIRSISASTLIEVWTDEEGSDFAQLKGMTGCQPRSYRDVFGRSAPHDRYLLVATDSDEGHGWQMSNSPLDLRTETAGAGPETPLRSRELLAVRMSAEELPERLRQWLRGGKR